MVPLAFIAACEKPLATTANEVEDVEAEVRVAAMDETGFWQMIANANGTAGRDADAKMRTLEAELKKLTSSSLRNFTRSPPSAVRVSCRPAPNP